MKYQVTLSARDEDGIMREFVIARTDNLQRALEGARQISDALPKERYFSGPVCFVMDEAGAIVD